MVGTLPDGTFVSYSYKDTAGLRALLAVLPRHPRVRVFEAVTVSPTEYVSTPLIEAVRAAPALVCIRSQPQQASPWVAFECEMAIRAGKPVYVFDPSNGSLREHRGGPSVISVHDVSSIDEMPAARSISRWLAENRGFEIEPFNPPAFDTVREFRGAIDGYRGLFVAFVRPATVGHVNMQFVRIGCEEYEDDDEVFRIRPGLALGCLEPPGPWIPRQWADYLIPDCVIDLTTEGTTLPWSTNRVDDLMVRILWTQMRPL
jgi:hypothetical protein